MSEKLHERSVSPWGFPRDPMAGVFKHRHGYIRSHNFICAEDYSQAFLPPSQDRHGQLVWRVGKILRACGE